MSYLSSSRASDPAHGQVVGKQRPPRPSISPWKYAESCAAPPNQGPGWQPLSRSVRDLRSHLPSPKHRHGCSKVVFAWQLPPQTWRVNLAVIRGPGLSGVSLQLFRSPETGRKPSRSTSPIGWFWLNSTTWHRSRSSVTRHSLEASPPWWPPYLWLGLSWVCQPGSVQPSHWRFHCDGQRTAQRSYHALSERILERLVSQHHGIGVISKFLSTSSHI
jgi:hypothetical protein